MTSLGRLVDYVVWKRETELQFLNNWNAEKKKISNKWNFCLEIWIGLGHCSQILLRMRVLKFVWFIYSKRFWKRKTLLRLFKDTRGGNLLVIHSKHFPWGSLYSQDLKFGNRKPDIHDSFYASIASWVASKCLAELLEIKSIVAASQAFGFVHGFEHVVSASLLFLMKSE